MNLIISHKSCPDGMTAAYIAHLRYPEAEILMMDHGMNPPYAEVEGKDVLVLDFSWKREETIRLSKLANSFRVLDHHKTAEAELDGLDFAVFDMNRSGAGLAWDYLFGKDAPADDWSTWEGLPCFRVRPYWVDYVEDRDLWRFALPNSKAINAFIMTHEYTVDGWKEMAAASLTEADWYGKAVLLQVDHYVREVVKHAQDGLFLKSYTVKVLNIPYLNCSEVGNELAKLADVSITWFERGDGLVQFSLRSVAPTDVSEIAKQFGGGGHAQAAGFQMRRNEARSFLDGLRNNLV